jgi:DNA-binding NtrC family response regulator
VQPWPGNVRQLKNRIERAAVLTPNGAWIDTGAVAFDIEDAPVATSAQRPATSATLFGGPY